MKYFIQLLKEIIDGLKGKNTRDRIKIGDIAELDTRVFTNYGRGIGWVPVRGRVIRITGTKAFLCLENLGGHIVKYRLIKLRKYAR